jgi:ERF superfamily
MPDIPLPPKDNGTLPVPKYVPPTLTEVVVERIRAGLNLEEAKEYYRFLREIQGDEAKIAFNTAMVRAQQHMSTISRDMENPLTRSRYASLSAVDKAIRPHYTEEGLVPMFDTRASAKGDAWILCVLELSHLGGHSREFSVDIPADGIGAKGGAVMTRTHATMSAITYGRRTLLKMAFNLAEADDDGNAASRPIAQPAERITPEQAAEIERLVTEAGRPQDKALAYFSNSLPCPLTTWADLPSQYYKHVVDIITRRLK